MKIAVCCKAAPGAVTDVKIAPGGKTLHYQSEFQVMNECDEYALEEAIALKRAHGGEVTVLTISLGDLVAEEQIVPRGYRFLDVFPPERTGQAQFLEGNAREVAATLLAKIKEVL